MTAALEAAASVLNTEGLTNASLESVATVLGVTKSALYYYFKDKEDLVYKSYLRACHQGLACAEEAARSAGNGKEKLARYLELQFDAPTAAFVADISFLNAAHQREIRSLAHRHDDALRGILETGQADGSLAVAHPRLANFAIIGAMNWTLVWGPPGAARHSRTDVARAYVDLFLHGVRAADARKTMPVEPVVPLQESFEGGNVFDRSFLALQRRESLLRAASEFFNRSGFDNCSLSTVVESLNVSKGALYHYVNSKEALLFDCYQRSIDLTEQVLERIVAEPGTGYQKLIRFIASMVELNTGPNGPIASYFRLKSLTPEHQKVIRQRTRKLTAMSGFLAMGTIDGSIRSLDVPMARLALLGSLNWIPKWYLRDGSAGPAEIREAFCTIFSEGLMPRS